MTEDSRARLFDTADACITALQQYGAGMSPEQHHVFISQLDSLYAILGTLAHHQPSGQTPSIDPRIAEALHAANEQLRQTVRDLEQRNHESLLLRQLGGLLQACNDADEAYAVIRQFAPQLFPGTSGALYLIDNSRRNVEAMTTWGDTLHSERVFAPDDCWALRRGQLHVVLTATDIPCHHIPASFTGSYLGVPMMGAGETMGVLHLEAPTAETLNEHLQELAVSVGEHLALALSNLRLRETLRIQSIRDPLTGLYNRRYMEESLEREIRRAARKRAPIGIIMLDIDHFKLINDTYGHDAGDAVLRALGPMLQRQVRQEDIACRYGGEEFVLIMPDASLESTRLRAERIREAIMHLHIEHQQQALGLITLSLGVAVCEGDGTQAADLLVRVDAALYQAKRNGRNRVVQAPLPYDTAPQDEDSATALLIA